MRLRDLIGQDLATAGLRRAVSAQHVPHAYLFEGPPGVGKRTAALGLAMALACERQPGEGCGTCDVCRRIETGLHPDVPTFAPDGPLIVLDQAQAIVALALSRPHEAPVRVIIVDDADRLNVNAANCLLKTLEEPSAGTHIVLCTSAPDRILPTIRSRTQRVRFKALPAGTLVQLAVARGVPRDHAQIAAALADGSVSRLLAALPVADDASKEAPPGGAGKGAAGGKATKRTAKGAKAAGKDTARDAASTAGHGDSGEAADSGDSGEAADNGASLADPWIAITTLLRATEGHSIGALFDAAVQAVGDKENKQEIPRLIALMARLYRDALAMAAGAPELALFEERAAALAPLGLRPLSRALEAIVEADAAIAANTNAVTALERMLLVLGRQNQNERRA